MDEKITVSISLKALYDNGIKGWGEYYIETEPSNEDEIDEPGEAEEYGYYDLYDNNGVVCMDGEDCEIVNIDEDEVLLCNRDGEKEKLFTMSKETFEIAALFRNADRIYKYYEAPDKDIHISESDIEKAYKKGIIKVYTNEENNTYAEIGNDNLFVKAGSFDETTTIVATIVADLKKRLDFQTKQFPEDAFYYKSVIKRAVTPDKTQKFER